MAARAFAAALLGLVLAGCGMDASRAPADLPLRDPAVPLGGTSRFDAARFQGEWHTIACLGACAARETYVQTGAALVRQTPGGQTAYAPQGTGVLKPDTGPILVVMWVDEGFRTAVVGDADGDWAAIIDRAPEGAPDRLVAATEILDFYGWDVSRLQRID